LHRDKFQCRYCGSKPGSEFLEVDHLIPRTKGGGDNDCNLVAACKTCNSRKSDSIIFPHDLIERSDDEEGWFVHKSFGQWKVVFCDQNIGVEMDNYGFIDAHRLFDKTLLRHIYDTKIECWGYEVIGDMERAFSHLMQMLSEDR